MAKRSRSKSSSPEPLADSPEDERVNDQVNDEVDEEEIEAAGRAGEDSEAEDQDGEENNGEAAADEEEEEEEENEEDDAADNEIAKPDKARQKKDKTQEILEAQKTAIDADMNNKGKGRADESIGSSSFSVGLNDNFESEDQSNVENNAGSIGRKKVKKLLNEEFNQFLTSMEANYEQIKRMFQQTHDLLQKNYEVQLLKAQAARRKIEMEKQRNEYKILCMNLDSVCDPMIREYFRNKQLEIAAKIANQPV